MPRSGTQSDPRMIISLIALDERRTGLNFFDSFLLFQGKVNAPKLRYRRYLNRAHISYLIAAGVPGGSGRGLTSIMPCTTRTR